MNFAKEDGAVPDQKGGGATMTGTGRARLKQQKEDCACHNEGQVKSKVTQSETAQKAHSSKRKSSGHVDVEDNGSTSTLPPLVSETVQELEEKKGELKKAKRRRNFSDLSKDGGDSRGRKRWKREETGTDRGDGRRGHEGEGESPRRGEREASRTGWKRMTTVDIEPIKKQLKRYNESWYSNSCPCSQLMHANPHAGMICGLMMWR